MITPHALAHGLAPNPEAPIYVAPGLVAVRHILVTASAAAAISLSVNGNRIFAAEPIAANRRLEQWLSGYDLLVGGTITAGSSVNGALTVLVEGLVLA